MSLAKYIGYAVRIRRLDLGLRQTDLARRVGIAKGLVNKLELSPSDGIMITTLACLADGLGCRVSDIIRDAEQLRCRVAESDSGPAARDDRETRAYYGQALRILRRRSGRTLREVSAGAGILMCHVCEAERTERPTLLAIERCAAGIGCSVADVAKLAAELASVRAAEAAE